MGRESGDPTAVGSSIALLQERFRQLEKMREKREEREMRKLLSESEQVTPTNCFETANFSSQPERISYPSRPPLHDTLSLGLNLHSKQADSQTLRAPPSTNYLGSADTAIVSTSRSNEKSKSDVDTSLHL